MTTTLLITEGFGGSKVIIPHYGLILYVVMAILWTTKSFGESKVVRAPYGLSL